MLLIDDNLMLNSKYENIKEKVIDNYIYYINSNKYSNIKQLINLLSILKTEKVVSKKIDLDMQYIKDIINKDNYYDIKKDIFILFITIKRNHVLNKDIIFKHFDYIFYKEIEDIDKIYDKDNIYYIVNDFLRSNICNIDKVIDLIDSEEKGEKLIKMLSRNDNSYYFIEKLFNKFESTKHLTLFKNYTFFSYKKLLPQILNKKNLSPVIFKTIIESIENLSDINHFGIIANLNNSDNIYVKYVKLYIYYKHNRMDKFYNIIKDINIENFIKSYYESIDDKNIYKSLKNIKNKNINTFDDLVVLIVNNNLFNNIKEMDNNITIDKN